MADLLGTFEQAVLLAVVTLDDNEAYGRAILRRVQEGLKRETAAGAVYATLERLEQKGMLRSRLEAAASAARAGRARRFYQLLPPGVAALNESKRALEQLWAGASWPVGVPS